jgi:hypothetical protein
VLKTICCNGIIGGFMARKSYMILKLDLSQVKIKKKGNPYNVTCYLLEILASSTRTF